MLETLLARIARALDRHRIPYMIIGGQAVLLYGTPRLTEDIDITLGVTPDRLEDLEAVVKDLGLKRIAKATDPFVRSTFVLPCSDPGTGIRVDFIFSHLPYEQKAIRRSKKARLAGTAVRFAAPEDLLIHKILAGRPRDLEDAKGILLKQAGKLDLAYLRSTLRQFSTIPEFSRAEDCLRNLLKETR